jgi:hypothetical protein
VSLDEPLSSTGIPTVSTSLLSSSLRSICKDRAAASQEPLQFYKAQTSSSVVREPRRTLVVPSVAVTAWCTGDRPTLQPAPTSASRNTLGTAEMARTRSGTAEAKQQTGGAHEPWDTVQTSRTHRRRTPRSAWPGSCRRGRAAASPGTLAVARANELVSGAREGGACLCAGFAWARTWPRSTASWRSSGSVRPSSARREVSGDLDGAAAEARARRRSARARGTARTCCGAAIFCYCSREGGYGLPASCLIHSSFDFRVCVLGFLTLSCGPLSRVLLGSTARPT